MREVKNMSEMQIAITLFGEIQLNMCIKYSQQG